MSGSRFVDNHEMHAVKLHLIANLPHSFYAVIKQSIGEKLHIELNSITKLFHPEGLIRYCLYAIDLIQNHSADREPKNIL